MAVESLNAQVSSDIPKRDSFVTSTGDEGLGVRLELYRVDRVDVTSECKSTLGHVKIPQFNVVVHGAGKQEVS